MSIFDSTHPSAGDSKPTSKTKAKLMDWITQLFNSKGYRVWCREEVPAVIESIPYHLDIGVLCRNKESFDEYFFWGVELDWETHESKVSDRKDKEKDKAFRSIHIPILRFRMEELYGKKALSEAQRNEKIWLFFMSELAGGTRDKFTEKNNELSIQLKENALTRCRNSKCGHKAHQHDLLGCSYRNSNKAAMYCDCKEPFFISNA